MVLTAIVIPARLGATRLPNKPLLALGNVPVVVRVMRQARKVPGIVDVVVATDVEAIAVVVREHGGDAMLTNPDHQSGTDRVAEVARARGYDRVINLQGDEPFIDPRDLLAIAEALAKPGCDIATLKRPIRSREEILNPSVVKVVTRDDGEAMYFSRAPIPYDRSGKNDLTASFRHIGVYGYNRAALERMTRETVHPLENCEGLEQLRALALGLHIAVIPALSIGHGIDTEADLAWAREHVARLGEAAFPQGNMPEGNKPSAITDTAGVPS
ncbi:MAG: 3-deoxy-manno-octulosonate cytidylyltransferase [Clostridia bacterium]|nr:3-deoxy-manno-octulosonate cytidylyltransferase [Deltaproteobacteria bacterium]